MKKGLLAALLTGFVAAALFTPATAYADGHKVVTLGADLTQEQKNAVLKYFGVLGQNVDTIYITNADERAHLGSYVPLEQIGSHTFSCAMVNPTTSGGIRVKTANLNWVTSNMIATTLSTSGVKNCEVLAACPFEVSGTGALTGVIMAYETASGTKLDSTKKDIATQELITTGQIANEIGQNQATNIVNEIKIQVIEGQVVDQEEVSQIVDEVVSNTMVDSTLSDEDRALLKELAERIAEQQYDYADMKDTLERVEGNVSQIGDAVDGIAEDLANKPSFGELDDVDVETAAMQNAEYAAQEKDAEDALPEDSILKTTDDTAFGSNTLIDATDEDALPSFADEWENEDEEDEADDEDNPFDSQDWFEAEGSQDEEMNQEEENSNDGVDVFQEDGYTDDGQDVNIDFSDLPADGAFDSEDDEDFSDDEGFGEDGTAEFGEFNADDEDFEADNGENEFTFDDQEENPEDENQNEEEGQEELMVNDTALITADAGDDQDAAGSRVFALLVDVDDVSPLSGMLTLTDSYGNTSSVDLASVQSVKAVSMEQDELDEHGWSEGTKILIILNQALETDMAYDVSVDAVVEKDGAQADVSASGYVSTGAYGIRLAADDISTLSAGRSITASLICDEELATYAEITDYSDDILSIDATQIDLESEDSFQISLLQSGTGEVTVDFYDAEGNYLASSTAVVPVTD